MNFICDKCDKKMQMESMFYDKDQHVFQTIIASSVVNVGSAIKWYPLLR